MENISGKGLDVSVKNYLRDGLIRLFYLHEVERKYFFELNWYKSQLPAAGIRQILCVRKN